MADNDDDIPVLTDAIERAVIDGKPAPAADMEKLQAELCASSLRVAEEMLRDACREAEHVLMDRAMRTLRAELPAIVRGVLNDHFEK
jgi:hypothetical protein